MKTYTIDTLIFEITRRCNMNCKHCLRGDAENKDIDFKYIDAALDRIETIHSIIFTGGEPTLNIPAIEYTLKKCKEKEIPVYSFFVATNGKTVPDDFLRVMFEWNLYASDPDGEIYNELALSKDKYHEPISEENEKKLKSFSFYSDSKGDDFDYTPIARGRGNSFFPSIPKPYNIGLEYIYDNVIEMMYVNVNGELLGDCDVEYETQNDLSKSNVLDEIWM